MAPSMPRRCGRAEGAALAPAAGVAQALVLTAPALGAALLLSLLARALAARGGAARGGSSGGAGAAVSMRSAGEARGQLRSPSRGAAGAAPSPGGLSGALAAAALRPAPAIPLCAAAKRAESVRGGGGGVGARGGRPSRARPSASPSSASPSSSSARVVPCDCASCTGEQAASTRRRRMGLQAASARAGAAA